MALIYYIVVFMFAYNGVHSLKFIDCGSVKGVIKSVDIVGCSVEPCPLKRNTNITFHVEFQSKEVAKTVTAVVHGIIADVPVPFPIKQTDACQKSNLTCPLQPSSSYTYGAQIFVKPLYPKLKLPVKWELKDENSNDLFCMVVQVAITD